MLNLHALLNRFNTVLEVFLGEAGLLYIGTPSRASYTPLGEVPKVSMTSMKTGMRVHENYMYFLDVVQMVDMRDENLTKLQHICK